MMAAERRPVRRPSRAASRRRITGRAIAVTEIRTAQFRQHALPRANAFPPGREYRVQTPVRVSVSRMNYPVEAVRTPLPGSSEGQADASALFHVAGLSTGRIFLVPL